MAVLRWAVGAILVSFLLLWGLLPSEIRQMKVGEPSVAHAQEDTTEPKRVYTNDDWPFNRRRAATSASETEPAKETESPSSARTRRAERLAPFVATPMQVVEKMLEVAQVTSSDVVYDLGSGDGRIVIMAAEKYGAKAVGVELDRLLVEESTAKIQERNLGELVSIIHGDLLQTDIRPATVVAVYLLPGANEKLRPKLEKELRPGTREVVHDIRIPGWRSSQDEAIQIGGGSHFVYLYKIPEAFQR